MKTFVERDTGQIILPGFITENPKCGSCLGEKIITCTEHRTLNHIRIPCPTCKGTGLKYQETEDANQ